MTLFMKQKKNVSSKCGRAEIDIYIKSISWNQNNSTPQKIRCFSKTDKVSAVCNEQMKEQFKFNTTDVSSGSSRFNMKCSF